MAAIKIIHLLAVALASAGLFAGRINAQTVATNSIATGSLVVTDIKEELVPELPSIMRAYVSAGTNQCAFLIPRGFRVESTAGGSVSVLANDHSCFINLRLIENLSPQTKVLNGKTCRAWLLAQYPDGKILSEFSRSIGGYSGPAFDLQINLPGGDSQTARVLFIPSDLGVLEFKLVAAPGKFRKSTYRFNNLLLSFRTSQNGKLENAPLSNKY